MTKHYSLIIWMLDGKKQGNGYGFPFDRPCLEFAKRLKAAYKGLEQIRTIRLRSGHDDNKPLHKLFFDLSDVMKDRALWRHINRIERDIEIFEKLRKAMRIAPKTGKKALNSEGEAVHLRTIEKEVNKFRKEIVTTKVYEKNESYQKMIEQIDKCWEKLFAGPIQIETSEGKQYIQPQRTNNIIILPNF